MKYRIPEESCLVLLDLGGVLANLGSPVEDMGLEYSEQDFWDIWLGSSAVRSFETGQLSADQFYDQFAKETEMTDASDFAQKFAKWQLALFDGAEQLLERLSAKNPIVLLSNTNVVHWQQVQRSTEVFSLFTHTYVSFETGLFKPDVAVFKRVLSDTGIEPGRVYYFDDNPRFVDAAKGLGINAHKVVGLAELSSAADSEKLLLTV